MSINKMQMLKIDLVKVKLKFVDQSVQFYKVQVN